MQHSDGCFFASLSSNGLHLKWQKRWKSWIYSFLFSIKKIRRFSTLSFILNWKQRQFVNVHLFISLMKSLSRVICLLNRGFLFDSQWNHKRKKPNFVGKAKLKNNFIHLFENTISFIQLQHGPIKRGQWIYFAIVQVDLTFLDVSIYSTSFSNVLFKQLKCSTVFQTHTETIARRIVNLWLN